MPFTGSFSSHCHLSDQSTYRQDMWMNDTVSHPLTILQTQTCVTTASFLSHHVSVIEYKTCMCTQHVLQFFCFCFVIAIETCLDQTSQPGDISLWQTKKNKKQTHLDFIIISSRHKQRLLLVEINPSDGTCGRRHGSHIMPQPGC